MTQLARRAAVLPILLALACTSSLPRRVQQTPDHRWTATELTTPPIDDTHVDDLSREELDRLKNVSLEHYANFDVGIIEFRDSGQLWSIQQADLVLDHIERTARERGATIVVFVHGWHHSANVDDGNLQSFRQVLRTIATRPLGAVCTGETPPNSNRLIGVYIGWRGESTDTFAKWFTIWSRKRAAQHIGGVVSTTQRILIAAGVSAPSQFPDLLTEIDKIHSSANDLPRTNGRSFTSLVFVGHILGAAMLLSAMQQLTFENRIAGLSDNPARRTFQGLGDLVVLLNPAIETRRYDEFRRIVTSGRGFAKTQSPVLLTISSEGDIANQRWFRISRILSSAFYPPRWFEFYDSVTALGFAQNAKTHELTVADEKAMFAKLAQLQLPSVDTTSEPGTPPASLAAEKRFGPLLLQPDPGIDPNTPFMVVHTSKAVIRDHNDIFTPQLVSFLVPFVSAVEEKNVVCHCGTPAVSPKPASKVSVPVIGSGD